MNDIEEIIDKYGDMVTRICIMNLRNSEDAKDCFQDIFIKLYHYNKEFIDENYLKHWLIRVSINTCKDYQRKFYKPVIDIDEVIIAKNDEKHVLLPVLLSLQSKYKNILYLYYYEGYKIIEIASILHMNKNTVKSRLNRGRKILQDKLGDDYFE